MIKIKINKDYPLEDALQDLGHIVYVEGTPEGKQYKFLPYWFEFAEDSIFVHRLGDLPEELTDLIKNNREEINYEKIRRNI